MTTAKALPATSRTTLDNGCRVASLLIGAASVLVPATSLIALRAGLLQMDGEFCGMSALGVVLLSYVICFALSLAATLAGVAGHRALATPRSGWRRFELLLVALPGLLMLGVGVAVAILE